MDQWNSVIFSDEPKFNVYWSDGKRYVWRWKNEAFYPDCISPTVTFSACQMVWGSISSKVVGRLKFITGTVNALVYTSIFEECLKTSFRDHLKRTRHCIFNMILHPIIQQNRQVRLNFWLYNFLPNLMVFITTTKPIFKQNISLI